MDWSTNDYTRTYADTLYVPESEADEGIYLLDEAGRGSDPTTDDHLRVPIRRYGGYTAPPGAKGRKEGFYGNVVSSRENNRRVFNAAWDERPMHYNPNSGRAWAHLVNQPRPEFSPTFPPITQSEALNDPRSVSLPGSPSRECAGLGCGREGFAGGAHGGGRSCDCQGLQLLKVFLLVVIVVLLSLILSAAGRVAKSLEKTLRSTVEALGALRPLVAPK
jgi:hypothetical protein